MFAGPFQGLEIARETSKDAPSTIIAASGPRGSRSCCFTHADLRSYDVSAAMGAAPRAWPRMMSATAAAVCRARKAGLTFRRQKA